VTDLGRGETEVLALALEREKAIAVLDDRLARRLARTLGIALTGTLGVLLDGKKAGLIESVTPLIDKLEEHGFRLATRTRRAVLDLAGEGS
jgi:predicted nucleic acid-binding protein